MRPFATTGDESLFLHFRSVKQLWSCLFQCAAMWATLVILQVVPMASSVIHILNVWHGQMTTSGREANTDPTQPTALESEDTYRDSGGDYRRIVVGCLEIQPVRWITVRSKPHITTAHHADSHNNQKGREILENKFYFPPYLRLNTG